MNLISNIEQILQCNKVTDEAVDVAVRALPLIDLTVYESNVSLSLIDQICQQAVTPYGHVAAVCLPPEFVKDARVNLSDSSVRVIALVDMQGNFSRSKTVAEIERAISSHADAVEILFPHQDYLSGKKKKVENFIRACSLACSHQSLLKVVLEVNAFPDLEKIYEASQLLIETGIDSIKVSAEITPEIAATILLAIKNSGETIGFKTSIGVDNVSQASEYLAIADQVMGKNWVTPETFRFGTDETLLNDVNMTIEKSL